MFNPLPVCYSAYIKLCFGGEGGIRTHDPVFHRIPLFESGAFSRSATSPDMTIFIPALNNIFLDD